MNTLEFRGKTLEFDILTPPLCDTFDVMMQECLSKYSNNMQDPNTKVSDVINDLLSFFVKVFGEDAVAGVFEDKPIGMLDCTDFLSAILGSYAEQIKKMNQAEKEIMSKVAAINAAAQE